MRARIQTAETSLCLLSNQIALVDADSLAAFTTRKVFVGVDLVELIAIEVHLGVAFCIVQMDVRVGSKLLPILISLEVQTVNQLGCVAFRGRGQVTFRGLTSSSVATALHQARESVMV